MYRAGAAGKHGHKDRPGGLIDTLSLIDVGRGPDRDGHDPDARRTGRVPPRGRRIRLLDGLRGGGVPGGGSGAAAASAAAGASVPKPKITARPSRRGARVRAVLDAQGVRDADGPVRHFLGWELRATKGTEVSPGRARSPPAAPPLLIE
jgi:hypothetical protein